MEYQVLELGTEYETREKGLAEGGAGNNPSSITIPINVQLQTVAYARKTKDGKVCCQGLPSLGPDPKEVAFELRIKE